MITVGTLLVVWIHFYQTHWKLANFNGSCNLWVDYVLLHLYIHQMKCVLNQHDAIFILLARCYVVAM